MRTSKIWAFLSDTVLTLATILVALIAIVLAQLGYLSDKATLSAILAIVTLLATSEIVENRRKTSRIEENVRNISDQISEAIRGLQIQTFPTSDEAHEYLKKRTKEAKYSIDQASIDFQYSKETKGRKEYVKARKEVILSDRLNYRYVALLDSPRRLEQGLEFIRARKLNRYFAAFYFKPTPEVPLISFAVFDKEEVFTFYPYNIGQEPSYIAIHSPHVAKLFHGYFEKLWQDAIKVETQKDYENLLQRLISPP